MRISDWSSDVCSSDLLGFGGVLHGRARRTIRIRCGHRTLDVVIPLVVNGDIAAHMPIGDRPVGFGTELGIEYGFRIERLVLDRIGRSQIEAAGTVEDRKSTRLNSSH